MGSECTAALKIFDNTHVIGGWKNRIDEIEILLGAIIMYLLFVFLTSSKFM